MKTQFQLLVESFDQPPYPKITRSDLGYQQTQEHIQSEVSRLVDIYRALESIDQKARLVRDGIDLYLRRYQSYTIEFQIGSHYRQCGVDKNDCDFEHVIPQAKIRDMLIQGKLTIAQAMNPPTCLLHHEHHKSLKKTGWASKTPSLWNFFDRYTAIFDATYETAYGQLIENPHDWTLEKHYEYFNIT